MIAKQICKMWVLAVIVGLAFPASAADHREAPLIEEDITPVGVIGPSADAKSDLTAVPTAPGSPPKFRPQSNPVAVFPSRNQSAPQSGPVAVFPMRN